MAKRRVANGLAPRLRLNSIRGLARGWMALRVAYRPGVLAGNLLAISPDRTLALTPRPIDGFLVCPAVYIHTCARIYIGVWKDNRASRRECVPISRIPRARYIESCAHRAPRGELHSQKFRNAGR